MWFVLNCTFKLIDMYIYILYIYLKAESCSVLSSVHVVTV